MSLRYKVGDLIAAAQAREVDVIAHGCNCYCAMGSGIAPLIKAAFPAAWKADLQTKKGSKDKLGTFSYAIQDSVIIGNLYTQFGFWGRNKGLRDLDYNAMYDSMSMFKHMLVQRFGDRVRIGLPKIGAGLAGGDWNVIEAMVISTFGSLDVTVYVLDKKDIPAHAWENPEKWLHSSEWVLGDL